VSPEGITDFSKGVGFIYSSAAIAIHKRGKGLDATFDF
jgi:hypothetical protein